MLPNPYTPGGRPRVFVGRDEERTALRDRLARVIAFGEMAGPLAVVTGPRGLGKTSLLRDVADQAAQDGFVVAWSAGVKRQPVLRDTLDQVTGALERADVLSAPRTRRRIDELGVELNLGVAKVSATFGIDHDEARAPAGLRPIEEFLHTASTAVRDRGGAGLLILIDELHAPLDPRTGRDQAPDADALRDVGLLLNAVQNMEADRERFPLAIVGAGLPQTKSLLTRAATFGERTHEIILTEFDEPTSQAVLVEPARLLGVGWDDDAIRVALARADGYPQALQLVGSAAWEAARPERGDRISRGDVERSAEAVDAQMTSMFQARWDVATGSERAFLRAMAELPGEAVARRDIAARLGVASDDLGVARSALISKGIIEPAGHGRLRFTIPGFGAYVRDRGDE